MDTNVVNNTKNTTTSNNTAELDLIIAYTQLVFKTLRHSKAEINDRTIRSEVKMFYEKFREQRSQKTSKTHSKGEKIKC